MNLDIQSLRDEDRRSLEYLQMTRNLTIETEFPFKIWDWLKGQYSQLDESDPVSRAVCSVINAILHQERIVFACSKRGIQTLMKNDKNFKGAGKGIGFKDSYYSKILAFLYSNQIVKKVFEGTSKTASGYEVINPELISYLNRTVNKEKQFQEVKLFCNNGEPQREPLKGTKEHKDIRTQELKNIRTEEIKDSGTKEQKPITFQDVVDVQRNEESYDAASHFVSAINEPAVESISPFMQMMRTRHKHTS